MPITYSKDEQTGFIVEVWTGSITRDDLSSYWKEYLKDPWVLATRKTLVDLTEATILFQGADMAGLIKTIVLPILGDRDWKTAIVVARPDQYGVSRQYQVFAEQYSQDSIFYDRGEALKWLLEEASPNSGPSS